MNRVIGLIIFAFFSGYLLAKEPELEDGLDVIVDDNSPDSCEGIFEERKIPGFPKSMPAQLTVMKHGACSVTLNFSVSKSGIVENIKVEEVEERCKPFIRSAVNDLARKTATEQEAVRDCRYTYTYKLE